jgi:hypothetical protein
MADNSSLLGSPRGAAEDLKDRLAEAHVNLVGQSVKLDPLPFMAAWVLCNIRLSQKEQNDFLAELGLVKVTLRMGNWELKRAVAPPS